MTDASGNATINFNLSNGLAVGAWVTATATNQTTGDTSAFSNAVSAQPVSVAFSMADYPVDSTAGSVTIDVLRSGNLNVAVSVNYATSNGSAIAGQDYTRRLGHAQSSHRTKPTRRSRFRSSPTPVVRPLLRSST